MKLAKLLPALGASALLMTYGTMIHALKDRGDIKPGETVLVLGAAGGVGLASIELATAYGAKVVAAVSSDDSCFRVCFRACDSF